MISFHGFFFKLSCGRRDISSVRFLEYWRSKHAPKATYKCLCDALDLIGEHELALQVLSYSKSKESHRKFSTSSVSSKESITTLQDFTASLEDHSQQENFKESIHHLINEIKIPNNQKTAIQTPSKGEVEFKSKDKEVVCEDILDTLSAARNVAIDLGQLPFDDANVVSIKKVPKINSPTIDIVKNEMNPKQDALTSNEVADLHTNEDLSSINGFHFNGFEESSSGCGNLICTQENLTSTSTKLLDSSPAPIKLMTYKESENKFATNDYDNDLNALHTGSSFFTGSPNTSDEQASSESGEDLIKRMFGQQLSVLEFFNEPAMNEKEALY